MRWRSGGWSCGPDAGGGRRGAGSGGGVGLRAAQVHHGAGHSAAARRRSARSSSGTRRRSSSTRSIRICGALPDGNRNRRGTSSTWTPTARIRFQLAARARRSGQAVRRRLRREERAAAVARQGDLPEARRGVRQQAPYSRDNIKFFSSVLAHYVSDGHVPFHAVLNYDGQLTGQWGIHSRFETELFERYRATLRVVPKPVVPVAEPARIHLRDVDCELPLGADRARRRQGRRRGARGLRRSVFHDVLREGAADPRAAGSPTRSPARRR